MIKKIVQYNPTKRHIENNQGWDQSIGTHSFALIDHMLYKKHNNPKIKMERASTDWTDSPYSRTYLNTFRLEIIYEGEQ